MSVYARMWTETGERIAAEDEPAIVAAAQAGDDDAVLRLVGAYMPMLRAAVSRWPGLHVDDARQAAILGLLAAVRAYDPGAGSLGGLLHAHLPAALSDAALAATEGYAVPPRTLKRFFSIFRAGNGDPFAAAALAPRYAMAPETWWAVYDAVRVSRLDEMCDSDGDAAVTDVVSPRPIADVEDRILCDVALAAVDDLSATVCRLAYGFAEYDPQPDAEIGHRLGISRLRTLRIRHAALMRMRTALGALID